MKLLFLVTLALFVIISSLSADHRPDIYCPNCSSEIYATPNSNCTCVKGERVLRKYACGPACDAIGYCCP